VDLYNHLLRNRIIFIGSRITDITATQVIASLLALESLNPDEEIRIYINTQGRPCGNSGVCAWVVDGMGAASQGVVGGLQALAARDYCKRQVQLLWQLELGRACWHCWDRCCKNVCNLACPDIPFTEGQRCSRLVVPACSPICCCPADCLDASTPAAGSPYAVISILDTIRSLSCPVATVGFGLVGGAAALVLAGGAFPVMYTAVQPAAAQKAGQSLAGTVCAALAVRHGWRSRAVPMRPCSCCSKFGHPQPGTGVNCVLGFQLC
jgi:hypothetical protein